MSQRVGGIMSSRQRSWVWWRTLGIIIASTVSFYGSRSVAQNSPSPITSDRTLPNNSRVTLEGNKRIITGGTQAGQNLFHSFKNFSVPTGSEAFFNNSADIQNIINRVTGGSISNIDGLIKANGSANIFLINPNGIVFGPNARLDIGGSFSATTANNLKFPDGSQFSAKNPQAPPLLTVDITPGLQYGAIERGANITNRGNLASTQDLKLVADKLDLQGKLNAGRNLLLQARDTVKVRDSPTTPFLARAGGNLTVQANKEIDILALNHPREISFVSRGDLSLNSNGIISGDARFSSGGNFFLGSVSGKVANFVSKYDPIISSNGDVNIAGNYTGASLLVESKGNIRFGGDINITSPDTSDLPPGPETATLSNSTALIVRSGQDNLAYGGVNSGSVPVFSNLNVPQGITIDGNVVLQPFNGVGGIVNLSAASGGVNTQGIRTNGGAIALTAFGNITTGDLNTEAFGSSNGGNITLDSITGDIDTSRGQVTSQVNTFGDNPSAGNIFFTAKGNIKTARVNASAGAFFGKGGDINLKAEGNIILTSDASIVSDGLIGGNITLNSNRDISIPGNLIRSQSFTDVSSGEVNGGAIAISGGSISFEDSQIESFTQGTANVGEIIINAKSQLNLENSDIYARTFGQGNIAPIKLNASSIVFRNSNLGGTTNNQGNVGSISVTGGRKVELDNSKIFTTDFSGESGVGRVTVTAESIVINNKSNVASTGNNLGNAGVAIAATNGSVEINDGIISTDGRGGKGGLLSITANDSFSITSSTITSRGLGFGGGPIIITANSALVDNSRINSGDGEQRGGTLTINAADSISIVNDSKLFSSTFGGGDSGEIRLDANAISLLDSTITSETAIGNRNNREASNEGNAGLVKITADSYFLADNSRILSTLGSEFSGETVGNGGLIDITTGSLSAVNGTVIRSSTFSQGNAGDIKITATDGILFSNESGVFSEVEESAMGNGGNIDIITNSLYLNQNARISANSSGIGKVGNIFVNSPLSVLRRGSSITTNASTDDSAIAGGNITIDAKNGFIVAVPKENSDISANSERFRGGKVSIRNTAGIYGIKSRKEPSDLTSDITAKGARAELSGEIETNNPNVDPTSGLVKLPISILDTSDQISKACTPGGWGFTNSFASTGRGGLPISPTEPLQDTSTLSTWVRLKPRLQRAGGSPSVRQQTPKTTNRPIKPGSKTAPNNDKLYRNNNTGKSQIVEATGWIVDADGNIEFIAQANQARSKSSWQNPASCSASR